MRKFFGSMGCVIRVIIESQALKNNMLGDPSMRLVDVYVPAGHDGMTDMDCPCSSILSASRAAAYLIPIGSASVRTCQNGSTA